LIYENGTFTFKDGSSENAQTYEWYRIDGNKKYSRIGEFIANSTDGTFKPQIEGYYYCTAIHKELSKRYDPIHNISLQSDTL